MVADNFSHFLSGKMFYHDADHGDSMMGSYWTGSDKFGAITDYNCTDWTSNSSNGKGDQWSLGFYIGAGQSECHREKGFLCMCY